ncbi:ABC transporter ATP-binding protein [Saccharopolyspora sp. 6V]|uniref:ABC transporter ATP-binding protein n=1 Tax=Saccharopolyspora sp. 6V TaxID=2877239 RepID=UPI001CD320E1|nr:ABC transporter ATP-binding protein [Saccharopolyspora sp. 6V]MCA1193490.1 ABC transporter ATP-binding protein/permease [Saccharopolyspora sp. 6V]
MLQAFRSTRRSEDSDDDEIPEPDQAAEPGRRVGVRDLVQVARGHQRAIALALVLSLLGAALGLVQPLLAGRAIDSFSRQQPYLPLIGLLAVVFLSEAVITALGAYALERSGEGIVLGLRQRVVRTLLRLPMRGYEQRRLGDLLSRTTSDTTLLRDTLAYDLSEVVVGVFVVVGGTAMMIWLDAAMFLIVLAIIGTIGALTTLLLTGIRRSVEDAQDSLGGMTAELERALSAIRTVRVLRAEDREQDRIGGLAQQVYRQNLGAARRDAVVNPAMTLAMHASLIAVLVVGGIRVVSGASSLADLVGFLLYVTYIAAPMANIFDVLATLQRGMAALQRVDDVTRMPVEEDRAPITAVPREPAASDVPAVELRDVWFGYEPDRPVLRGVSFAVPRHTHTALVGPSGAGKSTIFALLARFYDQDRGKILLDGRDTRELSRTDCRARLSLVEQHCPIMHGTLGENIAYGRPDAEPGEIERVVALAALEPLVRRLPHGLDTPVGDHGDLLSGGERQRVALARALLPRPRLLLLDEPTSQLDSANEAALTETIAKVSAECTLLVIAHRPSTIRSADSVVALESGEVAESSTVRPG